ncbi:hypothetical protein B0T20DRAFT_40981 [Sordaria brevicollis]|uniref:Uncharacterized protein n=1 Tax=Sordaria brevicollis TaxID=83679 RepID=A0AAE0P985_SORBR|nr:hypothetical protein B0T20DRAFT_40981 [Sordaria brevicollis]
MELCLTTLLLTPIRIQSVTGLLRVKSVIGPTSAWTDGRPISRGTKIVCCVLSKLPTNEPLLRMDGCVASSVLSVRCPATKI